MGILNIGRWALRNLPSVVSTLAAGLFALSYIAHWIYFDRFGVTPADVGIGYGDLVVRQTSPALLLMIAVSLITWAVCAPMIKERETEYGSLRGNLSEDAKLRCARLLRETRLLGAVCVVVPGAIATTFVIAMLQGAIDGGRVARHPAILDPLRISVVRATFVGSAHSVLVLGRNESYLVVYRPWQRTTAFVKGDTDYRVAP